MTTEEIDKPEVETEGEVETEVETEVESETPSTDQEPEKRNDYEERASRMGWVPQEKFRGDPERWVDAKTFVEKGENELPILRERLRDSLRKQDESVRKLDELQETVKEFRGYMTQAEERAYKRAKRDLEEQRNAAKDAGDFDRYDKVTQELTELDTSAKPVEKREIKPDPMKDPVFTGWVGDNKWFQDDPERAAYANGYGAYLNQTKPHLHGRAFLDEITKAVKKEFPDKFENPRRNDAPRVESGGNGAKGKSGGKSFDDLPQEAKAACLRFEKQGLVKRADYVKDYFAE